MLALTQLMNVEPGFKPSQLAKHYITLLNLSLKKKGRLYNERKERFQVYLFFTHNS